MATVRVNTSGRRLPRLFYLPVMNVPYNEAFRSRRIPPRNPRHRLRPPGRARESPFPCRRLHRATGRSHGTVLYSSATGSGTAGTTKQTRSRFRLPRFWSTPPATVLQKATCLPPCSGQTGSLPGSVTSALKTTAISARPSTCTVSTRSGSKSTGWYRADARGNRADVHAEFTPPEEHLAFVPKEPGEMDLTGIFSDPLPLVVELLTKYTDYYGCTGGTCLTWKSNRTLKQAICCHCSIMILYLKNPQ